MLGLRCIGTEHGCLSQPMCLLSNQSTMKQPVCQPSLTGSMESLSLQHWRMLLLQHRMAR